MLNRKQPPCFKDAEKALGVPVTPVPNDGGELLDALLGRA